MSRTASCGWTDWEMTGLVGGDRDAAFPLLSHKGTSSASFSWDSRLVSWNIQITCFMTLGEPELDPAEDPAQAPRRQLWLHPGRAGFDVYHPWGQHSPMEQEPDSHPRERHRHLNTEGPGWVKKLFLSLSDCRGRPPSHRCYSQDHQATECTTCWRGWPSSITPMAPVDGSDSTSFFKILQTHPTHPTLPCLSASHCPFSSRVPAAEWRESCGADVPMTPRTGLKGWEQGQLSSAQRTPRKSGFSQGLISWIQVTFLHGHFFYNSNNLLSCPRGKETVSTLLSISLLFSLVLNSVSQIIYFIYLLLYASFLIYFHKSPAQDTFKNSRHSYKAWRTAVPCATPIWNSSLVTLSSELLTSK